MSGFSTSSMVPSSASASPFFSLRAAASRGRMSATAAENTATSAVANASWAAESISRAVSTCTVRTPSGSGSATGPDTSVTSAPRAAAARARA